MFYAEPLALELSTMWTIHSWLWPRVTGQVIDPLSLQEPQAAEGKEKPIMQPGAGAHMRRQLAAPATTGGGWSGPLVVTDPRYYWTIDGRADTAVIPINGMIMKGAGGFQESCMGAVSTERISHAIGQAVAAKEIKNIVFDIGSPGGRTTFIAELSAQVKEATQVRGKTVYAFTDSMTASAAYWIASQADEIITTGSASIGSIGTYLAFLNEKVSMQMKGVQMEVFKQGTHKALGLPGMELTQDDRAYLQGMVNDINAQFVGAVKVGRSKVTEEAVTDAKVYPGAAAIKQGLADGLVASWDEFTTLL